MNYTYFLFDDDKSFVFNSNYDRKLNLFIVEFNRCVILNRNMLASTQMIENKGKQIKRFG